MRGSICGHSPCPAICVRVCHCQAGLARSRWLLAMQRNKRDMSKPRSAPAYPWPQTKGQQYRLPSEPRHSFGAINAPQYKKPNRLSKGRDTGEIPNPITRNLNWLTNPTLLIGFLLLLVLVLTYGYLVNGSQLIPTYEVPHISVPDTPWWGSK